MDPIPLFDLTQQYHSLADELTLQVSAAMAAGRYIGGPFVEQFETQFGQFLSQSFTLSPSQPLQVISCNSGTDALYLSLRALDIGPGDEVLTSAFSFFASAEVISLTGARPVFVDIDPVTFNLNPEHLSHQITPQTRAIIPVHLFGQPVDMTAVMAIAQKHHLAVVEDCAQAVGACWAGRPVGTFGTTGCFSFYPTKNLGAFGDGGAIITQDPHLADTLRCLKDHGGCMPYRHEKVGMNSRLDALQAVVLSIKLRYLREWNWRRRSLAETYQTLLQPIPSLTLPVDRGGSVWNQFTIRIQGSDTNPSHRRDQIQQILKEQGISSRVYYPIPLHLQPVYQSLGYKVGDLPHAEQCAHQVLSLPFFPELSRSNQNRVAAAISQAMEQSRSFESF
jgi:dTDP-4-amino-4,6-dideoxygalactose transaminase